MLDSVVSISQRFGTQLKAIEWFFTILFTIEYVLRLYSAARPARYARSFFGIVDILAIVPTYMSLFFPLGRFLLTIRVLRVLRVFRVLKLVHFLGEASVLGTALRASRHKIGVFLLTVLSVVVIVGSLMYVIEGSDAGFTSIPVSIYWAIVTLTTVGYGDIAPLTALGQTLAALLMITGYGIIAVPTGIVTVELGKASRSGRPQRRCAVCKKGGHAADALYCKHCGAELAGSPTPP
jgi:voltage-gated potassium channel